MRIAFVITSLEPGGAEKALVEIATRFAKAGNAICVIALAPKPAQERDFLVERLQNAGVQVLFCDAKTQWSVFRTIARLKKFLRAFQPELIQTFLHHANVLTAWAMRGAGIPVVSGIRVAEKRRNLHLRLGRLTDAYTAKQVCVSHSVAQFAQREMGIAEEKCIVIPNGVEQSRFTTAEPVPPESLGLPKDATILLFIGRLDPQKRIDWLLLAFEQIALVRPECQLLLVGEGPLKEDIQAQASTQTHGNRVHFLGYRSDVPELVATANLLLLTSAWEGMPNVVLEAMAAGKPIVTTKCEGVEELLGSVTADQCAEQGDLDGFVAKVTEILQDSDLANRLGVANQHRAKSFSWESAFQRYDQLYTSLLTKPKS